MRQAVVDLHTDAMAELGFEPFRDAGVVGTEVLSCEGPRGVVRIRVEERPEPRRLEESDVVRWWERVSSDGPGYVYLVEAGVTDDDGGHRDADRQPRCERIEVTDEGLTLTYAGSHDRIGEGIAALEATGGEVTLRELRGYRVRDSPLAALTDRQREVIEVALDHGYYDVPRNGSVRTIADELDLNDSTVAEHLQRAERNLLEAVLGQDR